MLSHLQLVSVTEDQKELTSATSNPPSVMEYWIPGPQQREGRGLGAGDEDFWLGRAGCPESGE